MWLRSGWLGWGSLWERVRELLAGPILTANLGKIPIDLPAIVELLHCPYKRQTPDNLGISWQVPRLTSGVCAAELLPQVPADESVGLLFPLLSKHLRAFWAP